MNPPPLQHLYVNPAGECNLACRHCWVAPRRTSSLFSARDRLKDEFTPGQFRDLLDRTAGLGLGNLKFTGGEPLLRDDFAILYTDAAGHSSCPVIDIETNGTVIPKGLWEAFEDHIPRSVAVSLDNTDPDTHDSMRSTPGAFGRTVSFIEELVRRKICTQVIMSTVQLELQPVLDIAVLCRDSGVSSLKVNPVQPVGRGRSLHARGPDIGRYIDFANEVHSACGGSVNVDVPPAFLPLDRLKTAGRCPVHNLLGVLPDGGISFCGIGFACGELIMGNFISDSLEDIWREHPLLLKIRTLLPRGLEGVCGNCIHGSGCLGSCPTQNYYSTGSFTGPFWMCARAEEAGLFPVTRKIWPDA